MKRCTKCGVEKPIGEFHRDKSKHDGVRPSCKVCENARARSRTQGELFCECGAAKQPTREACDRCAFLDGERTTTAVIDALRLRDVADAYEIAEEIGKCSRSVERALRKLVSAGRVRRFRAESDREYVSNTFGKGALQHPIVSMYELDMPRRAA
jgi:hypothetical protein